MKKLFLPLLSFLFVLYFLIILPAPALAFANLINYQGRAFNSQNKFLPDGCYDVRFEIGIYSSAIVSPTQNLNGASTAPTILPASRTYDTHPTQTCPSGRFYIQNGLFNALLDVSYVTNTFANYQNWGIRAAFYPTKDTTPPSTWPASTDWSVPQPLAAAPMAYTSNSLYGNSTASNIIGDARATGTFYSSTPWHTTAIFGSAGNVGGVSIIQNWPFIGFNTYYERDVVTDPNSGKWRAISPGKGAAIGVDPSNGNFEFLRMFSPTGGSTTTANEVESYEKLGFFGKDGSSSTTLFQIRGGDNSASVLNLRAIGPGAGWYSSIDARDDHSSYNNPRPLKINPSGGDTEISNRLKIVLQSTNRANIRPLVGNGDILISDDSGQETRGITIQNGGNLKIGNNLCFGTDCKNAWPKVITSEASTPTAATGPSTRSESLDDPGATTGSLNCPDGQVVTGITYQQGYYIGTISLKCSPIR